MKIKSFMLTTMAAVALVFGVSSCGGDDDVPPAPETPLAKQVAGSYTGNEVVVVDGDESSNETKTYVFTESTSGDWWLNMTIPSVGMGKMTIPDLPVKDIPLIKDGSIITGRIDEFGSAISDGQGHITEYVVKNLNFRFQDNKIYMTFDLKYGKMPFLMSFTFASETRK